MSIAKIATLSLVSALSLASNSPAQSAPLASLSAAARLGIERTDALQVRGHRVWHDGEIRDGQLNAPYAYGGSYLGYTYGGFVRPPGYSCEISCWHPYRWWHRRNYPIWQWWRFRNLP